MRRFLLLLVGLALLVGVAAASNAGGAREGSPTCAFNPKGRALGCLPEDTWSTCGVDLWRPRNSRWLALGEGNETIAYAKPRRPGVWQILDWKRDVIGHVTATNAQRTRWKIANARGRLLATARGPDGAWIGLVLVGAGAGCLE